MPAVPLLDKNSNAQNFSVGVDGASQPMARVLLDDTMPTYRASGTFTPYATAALTVASMAGIANKTIRIKRIFIDGVSTAAGSCPYQLQRVSALGTGGTAAALTTGRLDSGDAAVSGQGVVNTYTTAAQSKGTAVDGALATKRVFTGIVTSPTTGPATGQMIFPETGAPIGKAIVLRGVADILEIQNSNGGNLPAGTALDLTVEWVVDAS